jgi:type I restriction enzyme S subunit
MGEPLPPDWSLRRLGEIAEIVSGGTPSRHVPEFWGGSIPWATPSDITKSPGRYLTDTSDHISELGLRSSSAKLLPSYSLLMTSRATLGEVRMAASPISTNQGFKNLVPTSEVDLTFLFYQIQLHKEQYRALGIGSTFLEVNKRDTARFELPIPPHYAQITISEILTAIDELIERTGDEVAKLEKIKAGMMRDLFTRGLLPNGDLRPPPEGAPDLYQHSQVGQIPKEWQFGNLQSLIGPNRPIVYGILMPGTGVDGGVPVVKVKDIVDGDIRLDDLLLTSPEIDAEYGRSRLKEGDILLTIRGSVGRVAMVPRELAAANITQDTARIGVTLGIPEFFRFYLETDIAQRYFALNTIGVAVQGINLRDVRKTPVPMPGVEEQKRIAEAAISLVLSIRSELTALRQLKAIKAGLMRDLLTGRVRVPEGAAA